MVSFQLCLGIGMGHRGIELAIELAAPRTLLRASGASGLRHAPETMWGTSFRAHEVAQTLPAPCQSPRLMALELHWRRWNYTTGAGLLGRQV
jgi:hypothetical protein